MYHSPPLPPPPPQNPSLQNANRAGVVQLGVAFLLTSAKLATSLRLMGMAERKLKRDEEAEETLVSAMSVFRGSRMRTCLQELYAEADGTMESGESHSPPPLPPHPLPPFSPLPLVRLLRPHPSYSACPSPSCPVSALTPAHTPHPNHVLKACCVQTWGVLLRRQ